MERETRGRQAPFRNVYLRRHNLPRNQAKQKVLSPPPNISVVVKEGLLLVSWGLPYTHTTALSSCFEYQLEVNQQFLPVVQNAYEEDITVAEDTQR
ncbi:unnamed protein product [Merluccius merluccius]